MSAEDIAAQRGGASPDGLPPLREVIAALGLKAKKSLGQNFILDLNLTRRIARAAQKTLARRLVVRLGQHERVDAALAPRQPAAADRGVEQRVTNRVHVCEFITGGRVLDPISL